MATTRKTQKHYALYVDGVKCLKNATISKYLNRTDTLSSIINRFPSDFILGVHYVERTFGELKEENGKTKVGAGNSTMTIRLATYEGIKKIDELFKNKYHDDIIRLLKKYYKSEYEADPDFTPQLNFFPVNLDALYEKFVKGEIDASDAADKLGISTIKFLQIVNEKNSGLNSQPKNDTVVEKESKEVPTKLSVKMSNPDMRDDMRELIDKVADMNVHDEMKTLIDEVSDMNKNLQNLIKNQNRLIENQNNMLNFIIEFFVPVTENHRVDINPSSTVAFKLYKKNVTNMVADIVQKANSISGVTENNKLTATDILLDAYSRIETDLGVDWNSYTGKYVEKIHEAPSNLMVLMYWIEKHYGKGGMLQGVLETISKEYDELIE